jgi:isopentenyl phosphate kinase
MHIIKLGGSVITAKGRYRTFMQKATSRIIEEIAQIKDQIIIVHGGGSFGHILAHRYGIPGKLDSKKLAGFSRIHMDMLDLNSRVCSIIDDKIGPCISMPAAVMMSDFEEKASEFTYRNVLPVFFGDVYIDGERIGIISGDRIMSRLAAEFKPERAIFFTDVDGIYTSNPRTDRNAKLLKELEGDVRTSINREDVTGGMAGKIDEMRKMARSGTEVFIINGRKPERIHQIGKPFFKGTVIR